ncbi:MAG: hypothetical protein HYZ40_03845 [Rhodospirillales bacterium]|nr:hypothetical protein [Rhodospirillales bacterium]
MNDDIGRLAPREFFGGLPVAEFKQKPARGRNRREIGVQAEPMKSTWDRRYLGK